MRIRTLTRGLALAIGAVVLSALLLAVAVWRAIVVDPASPIRAEPAANGPARHPQPRSNLTEAALILAADADPFRADRARAATDPAADTDAATSADRIASMVKLIGTVVLPHAPGLAMIRVGDEAARVVRVGTEVGSLRLLRVAPGLATLATLEGTEFTVRVVRGTT
jgi:hypothetical protein